MISYSRAVSATPFNPISCCREANIQDYRHLILCYRALMLITIVTAATVFLTPGSCPQRLTSITTTVAWTQHQNASQTEKSLSKTEEPSIKNPKSTSTSAMESSNTTSSDIKDTNFCPFSWRRARVERLLAAGLMLLEGLMAWIVPEMATNKVIRFLEYSIDFQKSARRSLLSKLRWLRFSHVAAIMYVVIHAGVFLLDLNSSHVGITAAFGLSLVMVMICMAAICAVHAFALTKLPISYHTFQEHFGDRVVRFKDDRKEALLWIV